MDEQSKNLLVGGVVIVGGLILYSKLRASGTSGSVRGSAGAGGSDVGGLLGLAQSQGQNATAVQLAGIRAASEARAADVKSASEIAKNADILSGIETTQKQTTLRTFFNGLFDLAGTIFAPSDHASADAVPANFGRSGIDYSEPIGPGLLQGEAFYGYGATSEPVVASDATDSRPSLTFQSPFAYSDV